MKLRTQLSALMFMGLLAATLSASFAAQAHTASDFYGPKWGQNHLNPKWRFISDFPNGNGQRSRMQDGKQQWNQLGQPMSFNYDNANGDYADFPFLSCPRKADGTPDAEKDGVHWGYIDGNLGTAGQTLVCSFADAGGTDSNSIANFQIKMDSGDNWYTGTGTPGTNQADMWSVAAHEFGHATGRVKGGDGQGHFPDSWAVCNQTASEWHTMCKTGIAGTTWGRSLEAHDKDTFDNAY